MKKRNDINSSLSEFALEGGIWDGNHCWDDGEGIGNAGGMCCWDVAADASVVVVGWSYEPAVLPVEGPRGPFG